jgi:indolepyruvate ferredoxin oxidoreductase
VSTVHQDDQVAWGSPGCHIFAAVMDQPHRQIDATYQLGGEGAGWIGLSPFTDLEHIVQNQGDGSLFHSSYLNIRFAVASGVSLTFKILFNGSAANTGAQEAVGGSDVPRLCQALALDGVAKIAVIARDPADYRRAKLPKNATVHRADEIDAVLEDLGRTSGVTIFLYDGMCANEERRQRKRGLLPRSDTYVVINEDVCENCGDCGAKTNCMSLQKVDTEFGPKTAVHQSSCNQATACLVGDCPSFVTVTSPEPPRRPQAPRLEPEALPDPEFPILDRPYQVYVPGVGGTGVLTVNAMLAWAALLDGKDCVTYDQTGAAQKWGAVLSSIAICPRGHELPANKVVRARVDLLLALDLAAASDPANLDRCSPERTAAVINSSLLPTGEMIRNARLDPATDTMTASIERFTDTGRSVTVAAQDLAEKLFGDYMATNIVAVGAAHQAGLLPLSAESIEGAIRLNGTAVEQNIQAFRYGRLAVHDPAAVTAITTPPRRTADEEIAFQRTGLRWRDAAAYDELIAGFGDLPEGDRGLLAVRVAELIRYLNADYARDYCVFVWDVANLERERRGSGAVTTAVIRNLYKLMAYKDEYEVARLHLTAAARQRRESMFGPRPKVTYHLHPPLLRALGMKRKLRFGRWFEPVFRILRTLRRLRGTPFDPFGYAHLRREERRLIGWYRDLVSSGLDKLRPMTQETVRQLAELPEDIRGYEDIKLADIAAATERATELVAELDHPTRLPLLRS